MQFLLARGERNSARFTPRWPARESIAALVLTGVATLASAEPGDRETRHPGYIGALGSKQADVDTNRSPGTWLAVTVSVMDNLGGAILASRKVNDPMAPSNLGESVIATPPPGFYYEYPTVAVGSDHGFVVSWVKRSATSGESAVEAVVYGCCAPGQGALTGILTLSTPATAPAAGTRAWIARDPDSGRFAVAWTARDPDDAHQSSFVRVFYGFGNPVTAPIRLSTPPGGARASSARIAMGRRGIIVAWGDSDAGGPFTYRARFLTRDALLVGDEFTVAAPSSAGNLTSTFALSSYANGIGSTIAFAYPRVTQNPNGEDIVAGVYARRYGFDPESPTRGSEFRVGSGPALLDLDVNVDPSGHFAVAWVETTRVHLHTRLYNADAVALTRDERFRFDTIGSPDLSEIVVAATATGGFLVKFQADIRSGNPSLTRMQEFAGPADARPSCMRFIAQTIGTNGADVIHGGGFNEAADDDVIHGLGGNDWINAHSGFDVVCGGGGADVIYGAADADLLSGGSGDDVVDGGTGWDVCHGDGHVNADTAVQCETIVTVP